MMRRWLTWIAPVLLAAALVPSHAGGQSSSDIQRGYQALPRDPDDGSRTAALPYTVAVLVSLLVLVVVCMPTRKT